MRFGVRQLQCELQVPSHPLSPQQQPPHALSGRRAHLLIDGLPVVGAERRLLLVGVLVPQVTQDGVQAAVVVAQHAVEVADHLAAQVHAG